MRLPLGEEIPSVTGDVDEDGNLSVGLRSWFGHEFNASFHQPSVGLIEVIDPQKQPNPSSELRSDGYLPKVAIGLRQEQPSGPSLRSHDDPSLRPAIVGQRRVIFNKVEVEDVDEKMRSPRRNQRR